MKAILRLIILGLVTTIGIQSSTIFPTTMIKREGKCPVCSHKLTVERISSYNTFGGYDSDLSCRSIPIHMFPVTCLKCLFTGYADDPVDGAALSDSLCSLIRKGDVLFPRAPIGKTKDLYDIPAWIRYDLLIQTNKLRGIPEDSCLSELLNCSWSIRMEHTNSPIDSAVQFDLYDTLKVLRPPNADGTNRPRSEVIAWLRFLEWAQETKYQYGKHAMLLGADALRYYGETDMALDVLYTIRPTAPSAWIPFIDSCESSIEMEKHYQRRALIVLEKYISQGKVFWSNCEDRYLSAELARRTGNLVLARKRFELLRSEDICDSTISEMIINQIEQVDLRVQELMQEAPGDSD